MNAVHPEPASPTLGDDTAVKKDSSAAIVVVNGGSENSSAKLLADKDAVMNENEGAVEEKPVYVDVSA